MPERRSMDPPSKRTRRSPAVTPQGRENQLVSLAYDLAEQQLSDGTASAQVITNFLKLGSSREKLEQQRLAFENELLQVKKQQIESEASREETYKEAMNAFRGYQGLGPVEQEDA